MDIQYRVATEADIAGMAQLRAQIWGDMDYWSKRISGYLHFEVFPQKALMPRIVYVALIKDKVIGFIAGHLTQRYECDGELEWINVDEEHRGNDIAAALLKLLARWLIDQLALKVCVNAAPDNISAQRFYTKHGAKALNEHWLVWDDISVVL